jgi:hypothetical protein
MTVNTSIDVFFIYSREERKRKQRGTTFYPLEYVDNSVKREKKEKYLSSHHSFFFAASYSVLDAQTIMLNNNPTSTAAMITS